MTELRHQSNMKSQEGKYLNFDDWWKKHKTSFKKLNKELAKQAFELKPNDLS